MSEPKDPDDPRGLIREAYRIEGIGAGECRSIFLDWALFLPDAVDREAAIGRLLRRHGMEGHPMTEVLRAGLEAPVRTGRRGGRKARLGGDG